MAKIQAYTFNLREAGDALSAGCRVMLTYLCSCAARETPTLVFPNCNAALTS